MAYHHPDVIKALSFHNYQSGRDAVEAGLRSGFQQYRMEFVEHRLEYLMIRGDTAVEQSLFTIRSIPKAGGAPVIFPWPRDGGLRALREESDRMGFYSRDDPAGDGLIAHFQADEAAS
jgi:hypothetical protein